MTTTARDPEDAKLLAAARDTLLELVDRSIDVPLRDHIMELIEKTNAKLENGRPFYSLLAELSRKDVEKIGFWRFQSKPGAWTYRYSQSGHERPELKSLTRAIEKSPHRRVALSGFVYKLSADSQHILRFQSPVEVEASVNVSM